MKFNDADQQIRIQAQDAIRKALKKSPMSLKDLADTCGLAPKDVRRVIGEMQTQGALIRISGFGYYSMDPSSLLEPTQSDLVIMPGANGWSRLGFTSDNHLCNKHSRLDVLHEAYEFFEKEGIFKVVNGGNWIDGEFRWNRRELITRPGMDAQLDYLIDNWPVRKGVQTLYIAGDDHEGWYAQREGIEIGRYLQMRAEQQGRHDLTYLGYAEHDLKLKAGKGAAVLRLAHPGKGSAYAISYKPQKIVESYQGGEKPQILMIGHYHKKGWFSPREVDTVLMGCTCDQTLFMRKGEIQAHVLFGILEWQQDRTDGHITRVRCEYFSRYNRGFYERRFE
jgi:biotin operon repressor